MKRKVALGFIVLSLLISGVTLALGDHVVRGLSGYEFEYRKDHEENVYGPVDFSYGKEVLSILDTNKKEIKLFSGGKELSTINYGKSGEYEIEKICSVGEDVYGLDPGKGSIVKFSKAGTTEETSFRNISLETISSFESVDNYLYPTVFENEKSITYKINAETMEVETKFEGRLIGRNMIYKVDLIPENDSSVSKYCDISVFDFDGNEIDNINIVSDNTIIGANVLEARTDGYIIKLHEIEGSDENEKFVESYRHVDRNGNTISINESDDSNKLFKNDMKIIDGGVKKLEIDDNSLNLVDIDKLENTREIRNKDMKIEDLKFSSIEDERIFNEKTKEQKTFLDSKETSRAVVYLNRNQIMNNASSMHSGLSYYVSNTNLSGQGYWRKPRCIGGAGNYTMMTYCWGGNDSPTTFRDKLSRGYWIGNINTVVLNNTAGTDCSGYVGRCWGQSTKYGTYTIEQIAHRISASTLKRGDAWNSAGHIFLFSRYDSYGNLVTYESTTTNRYDRVANMIRAARDVSNYYPIRYNYVTD